MRRSRMIYLPDSGVEPGRDGRYDDMRRTRYDEDYTPRYERERRYREPNRIGFDRDPYARRGGMRMNGGRSRADYDRGYGGYDNADFFACMAEAFLDDEDAVEDKLAVYYDCIVEH